MRVEKRVLNDALRVLGKVVCQTSPVELYRSIRFVGDADGVMAMAMDGIEVVSVAIEDVQEADADFCVRYVSFAEIKRALQHDFDMEKEFSYKNLDHAEMIRHFAKFISGIWQIHPFREGNTRTTAVFAIKYLRAMGFTVSNDLFAEHSWYFRNALVRANYRNYARSIEPEFARIEKFFRNLLLGETNELKNRYLIISAPEELTPQADRTSTGQAPDKFTADNPHTLQLIKVIGNNELTVKEMLSLLSMKHRETFLNNYLNSAIKAGFVRLLYPDSPHHPRQKYLLTVKGLAAFQELQH